MRTPFFRSGQHDFSLFQGDCVEFMQEVGFSFDMIFADPPYFLSNGGISVQSGKKVCVDKGTWDKSAGRERDREFNRTWLTVARHVLKPSGTIWISGTFHNIFSIAELLTELDFKILNAVTWVKTNPPPNLSCRYLTHGSEIILWARREKKVPHHYNYDLMHMIAGNRQMRDVWSLPAIAPWEKTHGKHPTQKPLGLLTRIILASTRHGDTIFDPFVGSGTTGIAANLVGRRFIGIDRETEYLEMSRVRRLDLDCPQTISSIISRMPGFSESSISFEDLIRLQT